MICATGSSIFLTGCSGDSDPDAAVSGQADAGQSQQGENAGEGQGDGEIAPEPTREPKELKKLEKQLKKAADMYGGTFSVGVTDLATGDYAYVNDVQARAASVIKIFVEAACFQKIQDGELKLNQKITLQDREIERAYGTGILQNSPAGTEVTLKKCLKLMMTCSDNRAANIVLDLTGIDYVNKFMKKMGCSRKSSLGYWFYISGATKGNYLTTRDVNLFFTKLYNNQVVSEKYDQMMIRFMKGNVNTTKLVAGLPAGIECAHKTGCITSREHDCGIVFGENSDYVISVLGEEVANGQSSYDAIARLSQITYDFMNNK